MIAQGFMNTNDVRVLISEWINKNFVKSVVLFVFTLSLIGVLFLSKFLDSRWLIVLKNNDLLSYALSLTHA